jgi:DUF1680 family protein
MIPTWTYVKSDEGIYVNLFIGSTITVEDIAGTNVEMVQETEYPWNGQVSITVNPEESREFTVYVRVPDRSTSELYTHDPPVSGIQSLEVNGEAAELQIDRGYSALTRTWEPGDRIDFEVPMEIQRIIPDERIEAIRGMVALRYGPLVYNVERIDQPDIDGSLGTAPLSMEWRPDLLEGVMAIKGTWADGTPLAAIPNYARFNRDLESMEGDAPGSIVWIHE